MKLDPGIHIVMHSVLFLKPGVTPLLLAEFKRLCNILAASTNKKGDRGSPCLTPLRQCKVFPGTPFSRIDEVPVVKIKFIHCIHLEPKPL